MELNLNQGGDSQGAAVLPALNARLEHICRLAVRIVNGESTATYPKEEREEALDLIATGGLKVSGLWEC